MIASCLLLCLVSVRITGMIALCLLLCLVFLRLVQFVVAL
jgi:hypothetical protein